MRGRFLALLAMLFAGLSPAPALAFWEYGHETVASIAKLNVTAKTRAEIAALLRHAPEMATPTCPLTTIEKAAYWPDCVKELGDRFSYAYNWHYQNVNICKEFDVKVACPDGNCVSAQIDRNARLLKDRKLPPRERLMALAFLVHFMGDLHQPLHAGDNGDLGGNRVKADYGLYAPEKLNLHAIWDGWLAERALSTPPSVVRVYSPAERAAMAAGTTLDWSRESWEVSRDSAYGMVRDGKPCDPPAAGRAKLTDAQIAALVPVMRLEVQRGGLRLARLLDEALD